MVVDPEQSSQHMAAVSLEFLTEQLAVADELLAGRETMLQPQDLPGRYGRVIHALDHVLAAIGCEAVVAGGWAVWRHGFSGRMTQDVDIVLPASQVDEFLRVASVGGFQVMPQPAGRWPKVLHKKTDVKVDLLPDGERPGTASRPAPTVIPSPDRLGACGTALRYITLPGLIELKLAAGRVRDEADVVELVRSNPDQVETLRTHLAHVHPDYVSAFDRLVQKADEQVDH